METGNFPDIKKALAQEYKKPAGLKEKADYQIYGFDYNSINMGKQLHEWRTDEDERQSNTAGTWTGVAGVFTDLIQKAGSKIDGLHEITYFFKCLKNEMYEKPGTAKQYYEKRLYLFGIIFLLTAVAILLDYNFMITYDIYND